jgi:hypothetical protein
VRAFGVMLGPSVLVHGAAAAALTATARCALRRTRPRARLLAADAVVAAYALAVRHWLLNWGSSPEERVRRLPGDELVESCAHQTTRAVTIDAPVKDVWPWLAQIGQDRGGFYSYAWLENLAGCRLRNADQVHPEWQHLEAGELVLLHPASGLELKRLEPNRALALAGGWTFALEPLGDARTRLFARGHSSHGLGARLYALLLELPHFLMERKMLLGIKARAERAVS